MRNSVLVTLSMPWITGLDDATRKNIYTKMINISMDSQNDCHTEAGYVVSAIQQKTNIFSYEESPADVNFDAYARLSEYLPTGEIQVQVSKTGEHVKMSLPGDTAYYNFTMANFKNGRMESQVLGHIRPDLTIEGEAPVLQSQMKGQLTDLKLVASKEAAKFAARVPKLNPEIAGMQQSDIDFSL